MILTASSLHRRLGWILTGFIAIWGIMSEFVSAFQCGNVEPWRFIGMGMEHRCLDLVRYNPGFQTRKVTYTIKVSFWRGMGTINILTDMALILFPVHVIITLQMSMSKKITILTFFGARSLYVALFLTPVAHADISQRYHSNYSSNGLPSGF
jgi:hypothetical protein